MDENEEFKQKDANIPFVGAKNEPEVGPAQIAGQNIANAPRNTVQSEDGVADNQADQP